jgi:hypothetical protein
MPGSECRRGSILQLGGHSHCLMARRTRKGRIGAPLRREAFDESGVVCGRAGTMGTVAELDSI